MFFPSKNNFWQKQNFSEISDVGDFVALEVAPTYPPEAPGWYSNPCASWGWKSLEQVFWAPPGGFLFEQKNTWHVFLCSAWKPLISLLREKHLGFCLLKLHRGRRWTDRLHVITKTTCLTQRILFDRRACWDVGQPDISESEATNLASCKDNLENNGKQSSILMEAKFVAFCFLACTQAETPQPYQKLP